ncbi:MAG: glycoside hydrolase family 5 protein [Fibromonadaceae bacterium]|nr:glycoside hydrolase family 5 protein [Fibromonadaceae bacterium]
MKTSRLFLSVAGLLLAIALTFSCSNDNNSDNNFIKCQAANGSCIEGELTIEQCGMIGGTVVSSCNVNCLVASICLPDIPAEQCTAAGGTAVLSCPSDPGASSSSVGGASSNSAGGASSSSAGGASSSSVGDASSSSTGGGTSSSSSNNVVVGSGGPVSYYGRLTASGANIVGSKTGNTPVQVRGVSLGWSNTGWESQHFFNAATVNAMVDHWKAEVIRVPLGIGGDNNDYLTRPAENKARVKTAIEAAIAKDVYVIIDWHAHDFHQTEAIAFFTEMARDYGSYDHVIFEIFNEPLAVSWTSIRNYSTAVINAIRNAGSNNLVLVGTPNWDQDIDVIIPNPLTDNNVAYVLHFYAGSHPLNGSQWTPNFANRINSVRTAGHPVFVSEYGTVNADGNGSHAAAATNTWMDFLNARNISYAAWHVNNKNEGSAFFIPSFTPSASAGWTTTSNMTNSGRYIYDNLVAWANNAPWRGGSGNTASSSSGGGTSSSSGGTSNTRCKGTMNSITYDLFCQWESGCFAIDPAFAEIPGRTCEQLTDECQYWGARWPNSSVFINVTNEGSLSCNGTPVTIN